MPAFQISSRHQVTYWWQGASFSPTCNRTELIQLLFRNLLLLLSLIHHSLYRLHLSFNSPLIPTIVVSSANNTLLYLNVLHPHIRPLKRTTRHPSQCYVNVPLLFTLSCFILSLAHHPLLVNIEQVRGHGAAFMKSSCRHPRCTHSLFPLIIYTVHSCKSIKLSRHLPFIPRRLQRAGLLTRG